MLPSEVEDIGSSDYDLLWQYWKKEPWGTYRDNLHTALIAREVRRGNFKGEQSLEQFMITSPEDQELLVKSRAKKVRPTVFGFFRGMVGSDGPRKSRAKRIKKK